MKKCFSNGLCRAFATPQGCKFGDRCYYVHERQLKNSEVLPTSDEHSLLMNQPHFLPSVFIRQPRVLEILFAFMGERPTFRITVQISPHESIKTFGGKFESDHFYISNL
jgi:hypothetical protein